MKKLLMIIGLLTLTTPLLAAAPDWNFNNRRATNAADPINPGDLVTKRYGDAHYSGAGGSGGTTGSGLEVLNINPLFGSYNIYTETAIPATPTSGLSRCTISNTSHNWVCKNSSGIVSHGVQTAAAATNQVVTAIDDDGTVHLVQLGFGNLSGQLTLTQIPDALITNAKLTTMTNSTIKCRTSAGAGAPEDCTGSQALAITNGISKAGDTLNGSLNFNDFDGTNIRNQTYHNLSNTTCTSTKTINWNTGAVQTVQATANCTISFTAPSDANWMGGILKLKQDGTGTHIWTLPSNVVYDSRFPVPVYSVSANAIDYLLIKYDGDRDIWIVAVIINPNHIGNGS